MNYPSVKDKMVNKPISKAPTFVRLELFFFQYLMLFCNAPFHLGKHKHVELTDYDRFQLGSVDLAEL